MGTVVCMLFLPVSERERERVRYKGHTGHYQYMLAQLYWDLESGLSIVYVLFPLKCFAATFIHIQSSNIMFWQKIVIHNHQVGSHCLRDFTYSRKEASPL